MVLKGMKLILLHRPTARSKEVLSTLQRLASSPSLVTTVDYDLGSQGCDEEASMGILATACLRNPGSSDVLYGPDKFASTWPAVAQPLEKWVAGWHPVLMRVDKAFQISSI